MKAHDYHTATTRAAARLDRRNRVSTVAGPPDLFGNPIPVPAAPVPTDGPSHGRERTDNKENDELDRARRVSRMLWETRMEARREDVLFAAREDVAMIRAQKSWTARERYLEDNPDAYPYE